MKIGKHGEVRPHQKQKQFRSVFPVFGAFILGWAGPGKLRREIISLKLHLQFSYTLFYLQHFERSYNTWMQVITNGSNLTNTEVPFSSMDLITAVVQSLPFVIEISFSDMHRVNSLQEFHQVQWYDCTSKNDWIISSLFTLLTGNSDMDGCWVEFVSKASMYTKEDFFCLGKFFFCQNRTEGIPQSVCNAQLIFL